MKSSPSAAIRKWSQQVASAALAEQFSWILICSAWLFFAVFCRHGFDFTDEGFYYLRTEHPTDDLTSNSWFGRLAAVFYQLYDGELWAMRLTSVIALSLSGFVLYDGWRRMVPIASMGPGFRAMLMLSAMAGVAQIAPALSYKTLTGLGCTLWLGIWLHLISGGCRRIWLMRAALLIAVALTFMGKPPAAAGLALLSMPALVNAKFCARLLRWVTAIALGGLVIAIAAGAGKEWLGWEAASLFSEQNLGGIAGSFVANVMQYLNPRFFANLTTHIGKSLLDFGGTVITSNWLLGIALCASASLVRSQKWSPLTAQGLITASLAFGALHVFTLSRSVRQDYGYWSGELLPTFIGGVLFWGWAALSLLRGKAVLPRPEWIIACIVPLIGWLGAHNSIGFESLFQFAPWAALACYAQGRIMDALRTEGKVLLLTPAIISCTLFCHLWLGGVQAPYRQGKPLYQQTKEVTFTSERLTHFLDGKTGSMVNQTKTLLKDAGFQKGDFILAFYNLPGIVFAVGGRSPGLGWYRDPENSFVHEGIGIDLKNRTEQALMQVPEEKLKTAFIIQTTDSQSFAPILAKRGIRFPADYRQIGAVPKPSHIGGGGLLVLWAPVARPSPKP